MEGRWGDSYRLVPFGSGRRSGRSFAHRQYQRVGNTADGKGNFNSKQYEGSLIKVPAPGSPQLASGTREVAAANMPKFEPAGGVSNLSSLGIEYVWLIIKENRTYDQVLG